MVSFLFLLILCENMWKNVKSKFHFVVNSKDKTRVIYICKDQACQWQMDGSIIVTTLIIPHSYIAGVPVHHVKTGYFGIFLDIFISLTFFFLCVAARTEPEEL